MKQETTMNYINMETAEAKLWESNTEDYLLKIFISHSHDKIITIGTAGNICVLLASDGSFLRKTQLDVFSVFTACYHPIMDIFVLGTNKGLLLSDTKLNSTCINNDKGWFEHICMNDKGDSLLASNGKKLYFFKTDDKTYKLIKIDESFTSTISYIVYNQGSFLVSNYGEIREYNENDFEAYKSFPWKTSLLKLAWSPDKKFICSSTQENCLHFWPYPFEKDNQFQISGFPTKINCICWTENSRLLALSNNDQIVIWDFIDGPPIGKSPIQLNCGMGKITCIHYKNNILIAATNRGFLLFYMPDQTTNSISSYLVEGAISTTLVNTDESVVYAGTENGKITAFEIHI
ncbi:MAG: hypothetical protein GVY19_00580 [Bacteroidetes bacterium]|nr:hypothetical protein [Bacteroidota bacterium]